MATIPNPRAVAYTKELRSRLKAFPPDEGVTWAIFRLLDGRLCETCFPLTAETGPGWDTKLGFLPYVRRTFSSLRDSQTSELESCPLCRILYQVADHLLVSGLEDVDEGEDIEVKILSPSYMHITRDGWLYYTISLRKGAEIFR